MTERKVTIQGKSGSLTSISVDKINALNATHKVLKTTSFDKSFQVKISDKVEFCNVLFSSDKQTDNDYFLKIGDGTINLRECLLKDCSLIRRGENPTAFILINAAEWEDGNPTPFVKITGDTTIESEYLGVEKNLHKWSGVGSDVFPIRNKVYIINSFFGRVYFSGNLEIKRPERGCQTVLLNSIMIQYDALPARLLSDFYLECVDLTINNEHDHNVILAGKPRTDYNGLINMVNFPVMFQNCVFSSVFFEVDGSSDCGNPFFNYYGYGRRSKIDNCKFNFPSMIPSNSDLRYRTFVISTAEISDLSVTGNFLGHTVGGPHNTIDVSPLEIKGISSLAQPIGDISNLPIFPIRQFLGWASYSPYAGTSVFIIGKWRGPGA